METDHGYVVLRESDDRGLVVEVCVARDANGVGIRPHAVHTGVARAEIENEAQFASDGVVRYSIEPQAVASLIDREGVQIRPYTSQFDPDGTAQILC